VTIETQRGKIIVMDRRRGKLRAGQGLLQGLKVVWDHWAGSFRKNENFSQIHGTFTVEYPDKRLPMPQAYRNMPVLLYDDESGHELCTGCYQCQRICPPQVIHITQAKDPVTGKMVPAATEFIIEYDACMSCGFCAEVCPFDSIKMDQVYELSTADRFSLMMRKEQLNRPISYYKSVAPDLWADVQAGAMKKLQGSIKRRPDVIGLAASLTDKIKARRRELAAAAAAAPAIPAPAPAAPAAPAAKLSPEEKAAKLAAMKAANAAKAAGGEAPAAPAAELSPAEAKAAKLAAIKAANAAKAAGAAAPPAAAAPAAELSPAEAKAAKLAAIKAANAAKKGAEPAPAEAPAAVAPPAGNGAVAPTDDKAARLAAIKAANAAKKAAEQGNSE
jgi:NADH-quinone oxidoreductase subunit I/electron transport complex protein RnfC